ncbi:hypothetical protein B0I27_109100 [Arcticibacter pallidicorallinus]|uniref:Uncharacterized protein n=1 Tax=Arcticibacter pallidicorallinus TaxID=1259464 RepID=A0A2T0TXF7_9SPHI|nr:hypothetical protein [Arcticibacter pallidicorallinus]PRY50377.1 hypothetical protein B0I27_109100 [Arcticibacter pallidicorallinus]
MKDTDSNSKVVAIGQLRYKRTVYKDPRIVRLYMDKKMYFDLNTLSHYAQMTPDELIREVLGDWIKEQNGKPGLQ